MKRTFLLPLVVAMMLSSEPILAQITDSTESTLRSLIRCHNVLFALSVFSKLLNTDNENALIERIRKAVPRIAPQDEITRLFGLIAGEDQKFMAEIISNNLSESRAQEIKNEFFATSTPTLLSAQLLPN